jgi:hypothetical protein
MGLRQGVGRGLQLAYLASELGGDPGQLGTRGPGQATPSPARPRPADP